MLLDEIKNTIKYAVELDIDYLEVFLGYKGDKVLRITTRSQHVIGLLETYLENLDLEYKSEFEISGKYNSSYNLYVGVEDSSIFHLKET
ncbi:MAG: hypothetical protein U9Q29_07915 [Campylobacterota bacterium]|nr:hypothetical protein [Campylobacterota bacterium]